MQYNEFIKVNFPNGQPVYEEKRVKPGRPPTGKIFKISQFARKKVANDPLIIRNAVSSPKNSENSQYDVD